VFRTRSPGAARNTAHGFALVGMTRDLSPADLNAVHTGISTELRRLYSDVLHEETPDRMAELLLQLDQQLSQLDQQKDADNAQRP